MATCMIDGKDLSPNIWDEAIKYNAYIQNISLHKLMNGETQYEAGDHEAWFGHQPNISHFIIFGSRAWARIPLEKGKDLQPQSKECIMVGYGY